MKAFTKSRQTESNPQEHETKESIAEETEDKDQILDNADMNCSS
jgi:hypothetical protein